VGISRISGEDRAVMIIFPSATYSRRGFVELSREDLTEIDLCTIKQMRDAGCDEDSIRNVIGDNY
jgi:hypothetical protein